MRLSIWRPRFSKFNLNLCQAQRVRVQAPTPPPPIFFLTPPKMLTRQHFWSQINFDPQKWLIPKTNFDPQNLWTPKNLWTPQTNCIYPKIVNPKKYSPLKMGHSHYFTYNLISLQVNCYEIFLEPFDNFFREKINQTWAERIIKRC